MSEIGINQLLTQMRAMAAQLETPQQPTTAQSPQGVDFASLLRQSVDHVNETQRNAGEMATAFAMEDPDARLSDVMVELQKASVSFRAMTEVRNRLVSAYQEIMNMPI